MSLFTDGNVCSLEVMSQLEPEVQSIADALGKGRERVNLILDGANGSICDRAWAECRSKLEAGLSAFSTYYGTPGMQAHLAQIFNPSWYGSGTRARIRLNQIVTHDTYYSNSLSPIQQWVTYGAIRLLYQAASLHFSGGKGKDGEDRYARKEEMYADKQERMWQQVRAQGLPFVTAPLSAPGAVHDYQAGLWDATALSLSPDANNTVSTDQNVRVAITYYDASVYVSPLAKHNAESGPSQILSYTIPAGQLLTISIASLNPPTLGYQEVLGTSQGVTFTRVATHYNVYVGPDAPYQPLWLQNGVGIPLSQAAYTLPAALVTSGYPMTQGQSPSFEGNLQFGNVLSRG